MRAAPRPSDLKPPLLDPSGSGCPPRQEGGLILLAHAQEMPKGAYPTSERPWNQNCKANSPATRAIGTNGARLAKGAPLSKCEQAKHADRRANRATLLRPRLGRATDLGQCRRGCLHRASSADKRPPPPPRRDRHKEWVVGPTRATLVVGSCYAPAGGAPAARRQHRPTR